jgi:hypothetical protein
VEAKELLDQTVGALFEIQEKVEARATGREKFPVKVEILQIRSPDVGTEGGI